MSRVILGLLWLLLAAGCSGDLWSTPDQRAQRWLEAGDFERAAESFTDPLRRGVALFRAGELEPAAGAFARLGTAEGEYNRGVALVMLGEYESAIASFDRALSLSPGWVEARENREIARLRHERLQAPVDDHGGTGGQLGADEIVVDDRAQNASQTETRIEVGQGRELSEEELRALWLRRVQTKPRDFLKVKFAVQASRARDGGGG